MSADLIEAARHGDRRAFEDLLRPLIDPAYGMAFAMLKQREAAEDAVQEGAVKAWRAVKRLRPHATTIRPWFLAIVANEARSMARGRWWSVLRVEDLSSHSSRSFDPDYPSSIDLRRVLDRMALRDRQLLYLFFYLDMPFDEIGPAIGISASAAKTRLYRLTRRMRPEMELSEALR